MTTTETSYTQAQVDQALDTCCSDPAHLAQGCQHVCQQLPGVPLTMVGAAAVALVPTLTPMELVKVLAGFPFDEIVATVLKCFPALTLGDAVFALLDGEGQAGNQISYLAAQQALGAGLAKLQAAVPGQPINPPVPAVTAGAAPRWVRPLCDTAVAPCELAFMPGQGSSAGVVIANTGNWLNFLDPQTGEVVAAIQGGGWVRQGAVVEGNLAFAVDAGVKRLHALRADGSEAWTASVPIGLLASDAGQVFHRSLDDGTVSAFDAQTGAVNWTSQPAGSTGSAVRAIGAGSGRVVVLTDEGGITVRAFDAQSGAVVWTWQPGPDWGGNAKWIVGAELAVTSDGVVLVPLLPWQPFLRADTGQKLSYYSNSNQYTAHLAWSGADTGRQAVVLGWDSSLAYEVNYMSGDANYFPSLQACIGHPAPDPSVNGRSFPFFFSGGLLVTYNNGAATQVMTVDGQWLDRASGRDLQPVQKYQIEATSYRPVLDSSALYLPLSTGPRHDPIQWVAALPL